MAHSGTHDCETIVAGFVTDRHMLACTILYTLSGGRGTNNQPLDFDELMEATKTGFDDPQLFDHVKAGRLELVDLLQAMVDAHTSLEALLLRPFFWAREQMVAYLGEEVGNLLDPQATTASPHYAFMEALEAAASAALGGEYSEELRQHGPSWAALLDPDYPLTQGTADDDPTGWGKSRSAQQAPADVEHTYAVYGKNPSAKQKTAREGHLKSGKKNMPMANRRMVGLLKTIRNIAFAHRSQHVQFGRFDTEEEVMRYMIDPFPWLLMAVYQLDQEHKIAGSVLTTASDRGSDTAASTDDGSKGYSTDGSKPAGSKRGRGVASTDDDVKIPEKVESSKKPNKKAEDQNTKRMQILKEQVKTNPSTKAPLTREVRHFITVLNVYSTTVSLREWAATTGVRRALQAARRERRRRAEPERDQEGSGYRQGDHWAGAVGKADLPRRGRRWEPVRGRGRVLRVHGCEDDWAKAEFGAGAGARVGASSHD